ncbi:MAG: family 20 glycosylhydrolase [Planctomycetes bacterium]|nr:family 20 glycosylhydrolase [Planctomycetota bacterium]
MRRIGFAAVMAAGLFSHAAALAAEPWLGVHVMIFGDGSLRELQTQLPALHARGVTHLIVEINYNFAFQSHPEVAEEGGVTAASAHTFAAAARAAGIEVIPEMNCLGHQSWKKQTLKLLTAHPELDETPGKYPQNQGIYCRSWCPRNPETDTIAFALIDEIAEAFEAKMFHVGMDEVFIISSEHCERCKGTDPAASFALAVNHLHQHIVGERKMTMLMWGDRLLDAAATGYGEWEASANGTSAAIDRIPKDIVMCDWHYGKRATYPSISIFMDKGFRVWPAGWKDAEAAKALAADARQHEGPGMMGYLCTTWAAVKFEKLPAWGPMTGAFEVMTRK